MSPSTGQSLAWLLLLRETPTEPHLRDARMDVKFLTESKVVK